MAGNERVALVTGAARRIGAAVAEGLRAHNWRVAVHYRGSEDDALALAARLEEGRPGSASVFRADLSDDETCAELVRRVAAHFGRLDLLVNNASAFFPNRMGETTPAQWDELMAANLRAPFFLAQAAAGELARRRGSIVNITDVHAERPMPGYSVYSVAKAGLNMLTRALAVELGPDVRVNAVAPGSILWPEGEHGDAVAQPELLERTALKRQGTPPDVAGAVVYLADAGYVTGHVLVVDGGRSLNI